VPPYTGTTKYYIIISIDRSISCTVEGVALGTVGANPNTMATMLADMGRKQSIDLVSASIVVDLGQSQTEFANPSENTFENDAPGDKPESAGPMRQSEVNLISTC
jgi:hypothetical protein